MKRRNQSSWKEAKTINSEAGAILIKKACEHTTCPHFKCNRKELRIGGIDV